VQHADVYKQLRMVDNTDATVELSSTTRAGFAAVPEQLCQPGDDHSSCSASGPVGLCCHLLLLLLLLLLRDGCAKGACLLQPHRWDPLFAAAYKHASRIDIQVGCRSQHLWISSQLGMLFMQANLCVQLIQSPCGLVRALSHVELSPQRQLLLCYRVEH
jgi:hypothetical protein